MLREASVGIGAGFEKQFHHLEVRRPLLLMSCGVRVRRAWLPLALENSVQRRSSSVARDRRVGAALEKNTSQIPLTIDGSHEQWGRVITRESIDVGTAVQKGQRRINVPLTHCVVERAEPTPLAHLLRIREWTLLFVGFDAGTGLLRDGLASLRCFGRIGLRLDTLRVQLAVRLGQRARGDLLIGCRHLLRFFGLPGRLGLVLFRCLVLALFRFHFLARPFLFPLIIIPRHVRPARLYLAGQIDSRLNLVRGRLPGGAATLLFLEALQYLLQALLRGVIGGGHFGHVHDDGLRVRIGTRREKDLDRLHSVQRSRERERCLPPGTGRGIDLGPVLDEEFYDFPIA